MTRDQIARKVQTNLDDLSAGFFDLEKDIYPTIQDAYNDTAILSECLEYQYDTPQLPDLVYYDFHLIIPKYLRTVAIYNNNNKTWLDAVSLKELRLIREDWELMEGEPLRFMPISARYIALNPVNTNASGTLTIFYKGRAEMLLNDSIPSIPVKFIKTLEDYTTQDMLDQAEEFNKAAQYFNYFQAQLEGLRKDMRKRSQTDLMYWLRQI